MKHSPTPWKYGTTDLAAAFIYDESGTIADIPARVVCRADAAFIVKAVNAHEELLKALKLAQECLRQVSAGGTSSITQTPVSIGDTRKAIDEAIDKAK